MGVIVDHCSALIQDSEIAPIGVDAAHRSLLKMYSTEHGYACFSKVEQEIFDLDIRSLRFAIERGSVAVVTRILRDDPYFLSKARTLGAEIQNEVLASISWLSNAEAYENAKGRGSMLKSNHAFNIQMEASLRKSAEKAAALRAKNL